MFKLKEHLPWWLKISAKLLLKRLPVPYRLWRKVGLFQHGNMLEFKFALGVFENAYNQAKLYLPNKFSTLELGPGDSLATALIAASYGSQHTYLVDIGADAVLDLDIYNRFATQLVNHRNAATAKTYSTLEDMLCDTHTDYLTDGLASLKIIPSDYINFIFSQAVLEHIPLNEASEIVRELYRLQAPGGIASHWIDVTDHLSNNLHSLRFSTSIWESKYFLKSGFYTNRLRACQWTDIFVKTGYHMISQHKVSWPELPLPRSKLDAEFANFSDEELMACAVHLVVQK